MIEEQILAVLSSTVRVLSNDEAWPLIECVCEEQLARYGPPTGWSLHITDADNIAERITATFEVYVTPPSYEVRSSREASQAELFSRCTAYSDDKPAGL